MSDRQNERGLDFTESLFHRQRTQVFTSDYERLIALRQNLEQYVTAYEDCPASHRPDKQTIIEKLKEMLDGE